MTVFEKVLSFMIKLNDTMPEDLFDIEMAGPEDKFDLDQD